MNELNLIRKFGKQKVLVVGDVMLDRYLIGTVNRISPEAPVPVLDLQKEEFRLGGASNVAANLVELGAEACTIVGYIGNDSDGHVLVDILRKYQRIEDSLLVVNCLPTTVKTRIVADNQQIVRVDSGRIDELTGGFSDILVKKLESELYGEQYSAVILSDYGKGCISQKLVDVLLRVTNKIGVPVMLDPKNNALRISKITLVTPNLKEAYTAAGMSYETLDGHSDDEIIRILDGVAKQLHNKWKPQFLVIKLGAKGIYISWNGGKRSRVMPACVAQLTDVCGAGDTVIATMTLALLSGADIDKAAEFANKAAGVVIGKFGTATCNFDELKEMILSRNGTI